MKAVPDGRPLAAESYKSAGGRARRRLRPVPRVAPGERPWHVRGEGRSHGAARRASGGRGRRSHHLPCRRTTSRASRASPPLAHIRGASRGGASRPNSRWCRRRGRPWRGAGRGAANGIRRLLRRRRLRLQDLPAARRTTTRATRTIRRLLRCRSPPGERHTNAGSSPIAMRAAAVAKTFPPPSPSSKAPAAARTSGSSSSAAAAGSKTPWSTPSSAPSRRGASSGASPSLAPAFFTPVCNGPAASSGAVRERGTTPLDPLTPRKGPASSAPYGARGPYGPYGPDGRMRSDAAGGK